MKQKFKKRSTKKIILTALLITATPHLKPGIIDKVKSVFQKPTLQERAAKLKAKLEGLTGQGTRDKAVIEILTEISKTGSLGSNSTVTENIKQSPDYRYSYTAINNIELGGEGSGLKAYNLAAEYSNLLADALPKDMSYIAGNLRETAKIFEKSGKAQEKIAKNPTLSNISKLSRREGLDDTHKQSISKGLDHLASGNLKSGIDALTTAANKLSADGNHEAAADLYALAGDKLSDANYHEGAAALYDAAHKSYGSDNLTLAQKALTTELEGAKLREYTQQLSATNYTKMNELSEKKKSATRESASKFHETIRKPWRKLTSQDHTFEKPTPVER